MDPSLAPVPEERDLNMEVAGELYDLAFVHPSPHGRYAYRRAARTIVGLEEPLEVFVRTLPPRALPAIGPASERVILEHLEQGRSPMVERAVERSGRLDALREARMLRTGFLSRAAVLSILRSSRPGMVARADLRGDLQMHTEWSDGRDSVAEMANAAMARGYGWIGVSDHSYGLPIAGGIDMDEASRQQQEIDRLARAWNGAFQVLKGIEANIPKQGGVDMTLDELARFESVLAAPHSKLRTAEDQTERMLATVRHPRVHVLAHPRGRMFSRRGVLADWDRVFAEAAAHDVVIELDGDPYRQDLDHGLARRALAAGCRFALDSDAHAGDQLMYAEFALAHARLAGIPPARVVNTWPAEEVRAWAARKASAG
ncbi:MAG: DNA polymerase/3'-5' exonuclease PolX [Candidatus Eisenbacteria bacterium]|uniref:DNA polymerase/3'-5' exonuclease PolX n=1 Tax=Eiseniibacteriota bacterium TaxID=2212470 RepID=A0A538U3P6_UNCEI|nr:MAG: DNA polymerase/3'-5' exonuclease PolX [Candidatus Eisenbacteria bacterium]